MWLIGDFIGLIAGGIVLAQWLRDEQRRTIRLDRELDAQEAAAALRPPIVAPTAESRDTTMPPRSNPRRGRAVLATGRRDDHGDPMTDPTRSRPRGSARAAIAGLLVGPVATTLAACGSNMGLPDSVTTARATRSSRSGRSS